METVRREESTEVLNATAVDTGPRLQPVSARIVDMNRNGGPAMTTHQTETSSGAPYAVRRDLPLKVQNGIYLLFWILAGLLGARFALGFLGANPAAGFAQFIFAITGPFVVP